MHTRIITAGCILHNLMMDHDGQYDVEWDHGVRLRCGNQINSATNTVLTADDVRDKLCKHLNEVNI